jgi:hypothetical protein
MKHGHYVMQKSCVHSFHGFPDLFDPGDPSGDS